MTVDEEFVPLDHFTRLAKFWWVVVLCAVLGAGGGLIMHRLKPPLYEAQAVLLGSLDFNKIDFMNPTATTPKVPYEFTQYDEDVSLALIEASILQVVPQVVLFAQQNGLQVDGNGLLAQATIERKNAFWEVRFRSPDPALAQKVVNYWGQQAFADLKAKRSNAQLPVYLIFDLVRLADLPTAPAYYQTNSFVGSGLVLGLIAGLLAVNLPLFRSKKER